MSRVERRMYPRFKTFKQARVFFDARGMTSALCQICNLSEEGATVEFPRNLKLSNAKAIYLLNENLMIPADMRWNRERKAGLLFLRPLTYFMKKRIDLRICEFETAMRRRNARTSAKWASATDFEYLRFFAAHNPGFAPNRPAASHA